MFSWLAEMYIVSTETNFGTFNRYTFTHAVLFSRPMVIKCGIKKYYILPKSLITKDLL